MIHKSYKSYKCPLPLLLLRKDLKKFLQNWPIVCHLCGSRFNFKHQLRTYERTIHEMHLFVCMFCQMGFSMKRSLFSHILLHKGPDGFKCNICNKVRPNYITMQRHLRTHAQKNIPCTRCEALFKTRWELKSHEIQHSKNRDFICKTCGSSFINPTKLRYHKNKHCGGKLYKCDICGKDFNTPGNLTNHKKFHFTEKPFRCHYCSMSFLTISARKKHLPIHKTEKTKPYQCEVCNKKYTSTTSLAVHKVKFHSEGPSYRCNYCKEKFKSNFAISQHIAKHAPERPYSCRQCLCRYKNRRELRRHQRKKKHCDAEFLTTGESAISSYGSTVLKGSQTAEDTNEEELEGWDILEPEVCIKESDGAPQTSVD